MSLPNVRELFLPDPDHVMFECDLKGADAQVVAWEADDEDLKAAFRAGIDVHSKNAKDIFDDPQIQRATLEEIANLPHLKKKRKFSKIGIHATNYLCQPPTLSAHLGISVPHAAQFQGRWFAKHPGIKEWHERTISTLERTRTITNRFGYRRQYFDRVDTIAAQAVAWVPQSTVAICINKGWVQLVKSGLPVEILLQVHDSIVGQFHKRHLESDPNFPQRIKDAMRVTVPYDDPLEIGLSLKLSEESWGACQEWQEAA